MNGMVSLKVENLCPLHFKQTTMCLLGIRPNYLFSSRKRSGRQNYLKCNSECLSSDDISKRIMNLVCLRGALCLSSSTDNQKLMDPYIISVRYYYPHSTGKIDELRLAHGSTKTLKMQTLKQNPRTNQRTSFILIRTEGKNLVWS